MAVRIVQCRKSDDTQVLVEITEESIRLAAMFSGTQNLNSDYIMNHIMSRFGIVPMDARTVADMIVALATYQGPPDVSSEAQIVGTLEEFEP